MSTNFSTPPKCQISWKFFKRFFSCYVHTIGRKRALLIGTARMPTFDAPCTPSVNPMGFEIIIQWDRILQNYCSVPTLPGSCYCASVFTGSWVSTHYFGASCYCSDRGFAISSISVSLFEAFPWAYWNYFQLLQSDSKCLLKSERGRCLFQNSNCDSYGVQHISIILRSRIHSHPSQRL